MAKVHDLYVVHDKLFQAYHSRHKALLAKQPNFDLANGTDGINFKQTTQVNARINVCDASEPYANLAGGDKAARTQIGKLAERRLDFLYNELENSFGDETLVVQRDKLNLAGMGFRTALTIPLQITVCGWYDAARIYPMSAFSGARPQNGAKRYSKTYMHELNVITIDPSILCKANFRSWLNL